MPGLACPTGKRKILHTMRTDYLFLKKCLLLLWMAMGMTVPSLAQKSAPAHLGLFYPVSTHGSQAAAYSNDFSLHVWTGLSAGERAFALYGIAGLVRGDASGFLSAGLLLDVQGELRGMQLSGLMNRSLQAPQGVQLAGLLNLLEGQTPLQVSGIINRAHQITALQITGIANLANDVNGLQVSGIINKSRGVRGLQIGGIGNMAKTVRGSQISGIFNKAGSISGIQLAGIVNVADSSDYPIGIINIIKNGERSIQVSTDENLSSIISFRSGGRKLYGIIGLGTSFRHEELPFAVETGMGINLLKTSNFGIDLEVSQLVLTDFRHREYYRSGLKILPRVKLSNNLEVFAGPNVNYLNITDNLASDFSNLEIWERQSSMGRESVNIGFTGGIQIKVSRNSGTPH